jgi:hypothetical protein
MAKRQRRPSLFVRRRGRLVVSFEGVRAALRPEPIVSLPSWAVGVHLTHLSFEASAVADEALSRFAERDGRRRHGLDELLDVNDRLGRVDEEMRAKEDQIQANDERVIELEGENEQNQQEFDQNQETIAALREESNALRSLMHEL